MRRVDGAWGGDPRPAVVAATGALATRPHGGLTPARPFATRTATRRRLGSRAPCSGNGTRFATKGAARSDTHTNAPHLTPLRVWTRGLGAKEFDSPPTARPGGP